MTFLGSPQNGILVQGKSVDGLIGNSASGHFNQTNLLSQNISSGVFQLDNCKSFIAQKTSLDFTGFQA
jgi:hypothetical protein